MKKRLLLILFLTFTIFAYSQDVNVKECPKNLKKCFDTLHYVYKNYCKYSRFELANIIQKHVITTLYASNFETNLKKTESSGYVVYRKLIEHMLYSLYGNTKFATTAFEEAKTAYRNLNITQLKAYNKNIFRFKDSEDTINIFKNIECVYLVFKNLKIDKNILLDLGNIKREIMNWDLKSQNSVDKNQNFKDYSTDLRYFAVTYKDLNRGFYLLSKGNLDDEDVVSYRKEAIEISNKFKASLYYKNDFNILFKLFEFFKNAFDQTPTKNKYDLPTITTPLNDLIDNFNGLINTHNCVKYITLNDYKQFFSNGIRDSLDCLIKRYKVLNSNYNPKSLESFKSCFSDIIESEVKNIAIIDSSKQAISSSGNSGVAVIDSSKQEISGSGNSGVVVIDSIKPNKKFAFNILDSMSIIYFEYKDIIYKMSKDFLNSDSQKLVIIKNIPPKTTYENILELYNLPEEIAKRVVFERLLVKNISNITVAKNNDIEIEYSEKYNKIYDMNYNDYLPETFALYSLSYLNLKINSLSDVAGKSNVKNNPLKITLLKRNTL